LLARVEQVYLQDERVRTLAVESARTEAAGYCKATRIEEIMDFARRIGASRLGIAHCVGLMREARAAREIFLAGGFEVYTACCKVGSIPKEAIGLQDEDKIRPGRVRGPVQPCRPGGAPGPGGLPAKRRHRGCVWATTASSSAIRRLRSRCSSQRTGSRDTIP